VTGNWGISLQEIRRTIKNFIQDSRYFGLDSNLGSLEYKSRTLPLHQSAPCYLSGHASMKNYEEHVHVITRVIPCLSDDEIERMSQNLFTSNGACLKTKGGHFQQSLKWDIRIYVPYLQ
jgi:hypothetical protein